MTVNGAINPHGLSTTYHFEYGLTPSYGLRSHAETLPPRLQAYYHESWDEGFGGWQSWGLRASHRSEGGDSKGFLNIAEPASLNDFNHEMAGVLHQVTYLYPGPIQPRDSSGKSTSVFLGGGDPDLRDARVTIRVRGHEWRPHGSELVWWTQSQSNIRVGDDRGFKRANWAYTGFTLTDHLLDGQWHRVEYRLRNESSTWTYGGSNPALHGSKRWPYWPIDSALGHVNGNFFHLLAFVNADDPPTGSIDVDEFELAYRNKSLLLPSNGARLLSSPRSEDDPARLTDGWRHGPDHMWRSDPSPASPLEFVYAFDRPVTIHTVQLHQNPDWPAKDVQVMVSADGRTYSSLVTRVLPERGEPNANFAFTIDTGLSAGARFLKLCLHSGYKSRYWGLGEIEAFGSGAVMLPDDDLYFVNADIHDLTPGTTCHYRLVATNSLGTTLGNDWAFTLPATNRPHVETGRFMRPTRSSASVEGRLNPLGLPSYFYFEYGRDSRYGFRSPIAYAGLEITPRSVFATLADLESSATYHYRLVGVNGSGTSLGSDATFRTR